MLRKNRKGQSLVEFALILPILLLVLLGIIEGAWIVWGYISVQNAAREAARFAVTGGPLDASGKAWTASEPDRVVAIVKEAERAAWFLPVEYRAYPVLSSTVTLEQAKQISETLYTTYSQYPRALGVLVMGQTVASVATAKETGAADEGELYSPGEKGLNVFVRVYYNANLLDPLYNALMGGNIIHLTGEVALQNEGLNAALGGELPPFAPPPPPQQTVTPPADSGNGILAVNYQGVQTTTVPAGADVNIILAQHQLNQVYYVCFDDISIPESPITTDSNGMYTISGHNIPLATALGPHTFSSSLYPDCSSPTASATIEVVLPVNPAIDVYDSGHMAHGWPDNSLLPIIISAHDANTQYPIYFDGVSMYNNDTPPTPCAITTTGARSGTGTCVIPNNTLPGTTHTISTTFAVNQVEVVRPSLEVNGGVNFHDQQPINLILRGHAPQHNYYVYYQITPPGAVGQINGTAISNTVQTNTDGEAELSYTIPANTQGSMVLQTQDRSTPVLPSTNRQIAATVITVTIPTTALIDVMPDPVRAGEVVKIQLRVHRPNTTYDVKFDTTVADTVTTNINGDYLTLNYQVPISLQGVKMITSFLHSTGLYSATRAITVLPSPYILFNGGYNEQFAPGETILITLKNHQANAAYDVYFDLNGNKSIADDTPIRQNIVTDINGEKSFSYTIPINVQPIGLTYDKAHPVVSLRSNQSVQSAVKNLYVVMANLVVTAINLPSQPQPGPDLPIGLSIRNSSTITLNTQFPFDNDLYFNPPAGIPDLNNALPPGTEKLWINSIGPSQTIVITPFISVYNYGSYTVTGRTNTSKIVAETVYSDNILARTLTLTCSLTPVTDNFTDSVISGWNFTSFGTVAYTTTQLKAPLFPLHDYNIQPAALTPKNTIALAPPTTAWVAPKNSAAPAPAAIPLLQSGFLAAPYNLALLYAGGGNMNVTWNYLYDLAPGMVVTYTNDDFSSNDGGWIFKDIADPNNVMTGTRKAAGGWPTGVLTITNSPATASTNVEAGFSHSFILTAPQVITITFNRALTLTGSSGSDYGQINLGLTGAGVSTVTTVVTANSSDWTRTWNEGLYSQAFNLTAGVYTFTLSAFDSLVGTGSRKMDARFDNIKIVGYIPPSQPTDFQVERSDNGGAWSFLGSVPYSYAPGVTTHSYNDTVSASCGVSYSYRVRAVNADVSPNEISAYSSTAMTFIICPPTLTATALNTNTIRVNWSHSGNTATTNGYVLERAPDGVTWTSVATITPYNATSVYTNTGLTCDTTYSYRVRAYYTTGGITYYSGYSNVDADAPPCPTPATPINLTATALNTNTIRVTWSYTAPLATTTGYALERALDGVTWTRVATVTPGSTQIYTNTGLTCDTYSYRVRAYYTTGGNTYYSGYSNVDDAAPLCPTPATPINLIATAFNTNTIRVTWSYTALITTTTGYALERAPDGVTWSEITTVTPGSTQAYTNTGLTCSSTYSYSYRVRAYYTTGGITYYSRYSNVDDALLPCPAFVAPDNLVITPTAVITGSQAVLTWRDNSSDESGFRIERSISGTAWIWVASVVSNTTRYTDTTFLCSQAYSYRVVAYRLSDGAEGASAPASAFIGCPSLPPPDNVAITATVTITDSFSVVTWRDNSFDESGFRIERRLSSGTSWVQLATVAANTTRYTDTTFLCSDAYVYRVVAFRNQDGATGTSAETAFSTTCKACTRTQESGGILILCSSGRDIAQSDDNSSGSGYLFMNRTMNSRVFDMVVRLNSVPNTSANARAGLEVRDTSGGSTARKIELVVRYGASREVVALTRAITAGAVTQAASVDTGGGLPTWLRIERANGFFNLYYNTQDTTTPVLGGWTLLTRIPDQLGASVYIGMLNSTGVTSTTYGASTWQQFSVGCPGLASATCGAVTDDKGTVVINALNYTDNFKSKTTTDKWGVTSQAVTTPYAYTYAAMTYSGSNYTGDPSTSNPYTNAPMLEYAVNIQTPGQYYVWILGYAANTSRDSLHVGVDGLPNRLSDKMEAGLTDLRWFNSTADGVAAVTPNLSLGVHTINVWGRESGFDLIQILLTTKSPSDFAPTLPTNKPATRDQSACLVPVPPEFPPNMQQCNQVLQNPSFEDSILNPVWFMPQIENVALNPFRYPEIGANWGVFMPASFFAGKQNAPYLDQTFQIPVWINNQTTANLTLYKAVQKLTNADGLSINSPNDYLYFVLQDQGGNNLTQNIPIATGADNPADNRINIDPQNPDPPDGKHDWVQVNVDIFGNLLVDRNLIAGQTVKAHFFAPNPGAGANRYTTNFYLDKITLDVCSKQAEPNNGQPETGKGIIKGVLSVRQETLKYFQGMIVWAYKVNGPLLTTYTVNGGPISPNYGFYGLEPGVYVLYSQFTDSDGQTYDEQQSVNVMAGQTTMQNLELR